MSDTEREPWVRPWLADPVEADIPVEWLRSRPRHIQELIRRFPPHCVVSAKGYAELLVPGEGEHAIVVGSERIAGVDTILVIREPGSQQVFQCAAEDLVVVGVWRGITTARIEAILNTRADE